MARLTVKQLAERHSVSRAIIYVWVEERRFPVLRVGERCALRVDVPRCGPLRFDELSRPPRERSRLVDARRRNAAPRRVVHAPA